MTIEGFDTDEGVKACLTPDPDQARTCLFVKDHDGPHGWEIDAEIDALANEIQMETNCPEEVAAAAARYASGRIQDWKRGYESAFRTAEVARSLAVDFREAAISVIEAWDNWTSETDSFAPQVTAAIEELRKAVGDE